MPDAPTAGSAADASVWAGRQRFVNGDGSNTSGADDTSVPVAQEPALLRGSHGSPGIP